MEILPITQQNRQDLLLPNEPFSMPGRFIPELRDGTWSYRIEWFEKTRTMTFPDEAYQFGELSQNGIAFGAYRDGKCIGLAIFQNGAFGHLYLYDLKVCAAARGMGTGRALLEAGLREARSRGYRGLYTIAQDDNVNACLFYLKAGFAIGGFDNHVYKGTSQEGKADIIFYTK